MDGILHYINDANTRFTNLLYTNKRRKFWKLARIDINDVPYVRDGDDYNECLFDDRYDLTIFYIENGDRKVDLPSFESKVDLICTFNMNNFSSYEHDDIVNKVVNILQVTPFKIDNISFDSEALKGFDYSDKMSDSMRPYFVFRIKTKLVGQLKQK